jgi:outer membrane protein OmpA-like peptidoglycan-associated protein
MLTQARAEEVVGFLWAYGIPAEILNAEGYGDEHSIADNHLIHGSSFNRRIEIQWINKKICPREPKLAVYDSK